MGEMDLTKFITTKESYMQPIVLTGESIAITGIIYKIFRWKVEAFDFVAFTLVVLSFLYLIVLTRLKISIWRLDKQLRKTTVVQNDFKLIYKFRKSMYKVLNGDKYSLASSEISELRRRVKKNIINVHEVIEVLELMSK